MLSLVHTLERFNLQSANVILESAHNHSTLWLGDFTAAIDKRWQIDNGLAAVLTVAAGLNIEPADGVEHLVNRFFN
jgi:dual specificity phosphatase 12